MGDSMLYLRGLRFGETVNMQINQLKNRVVGVAGILSVLLLGGCGGGGSGSGGLSSTSSSAKARTFSNPLSKQYIPDPWVLRHDGYYLFTSTPTKSGTIEIGKSPSIEEIGNARKKAVWRAPATGRNSRDIWAPEIHFLRGKWYIYYTATDGPDANRRLWVLESQTSDPQGAYISRGQIREKGEDLYAIDANVFEHNGALYLLWSGRENDGTDQSIYIAPMSDPWTISGPRVILSRPYFGWEKRGWPVNEAPQALQRNGQTFIVYSASGGSTPHYCLGMLTHTGGDLLDASSWKKSSEPVFKSYEAAKGGVYGPGHNSFTTSPDGSENWIVYHAKDKAIDGWPNRLLRAQKFSWNSDGTPSFGQPVSPGVKIPVPR